MRYLLIIVFLLLLSCTSNKKTGAYKVITVNGVQLHYQIAGEGEPLILIHGSLADLRYWDAQTPALSQNFRVIEYSRRYNHPNQNELEQDHSAIIEAEDLLAFMDELGLKKASILGHSYGAYTALWFAMEQPERINKLILAEAPVLRWLPDIPGGEGIMEGFLANIWEPIGKAYSDGGKQAGLEFTSQWYFSAPFDSITPEWKLYFTQNSKEWEALAVSSDAYPHIDHQKIENLNMPVLLISGSRSAGNFNDLIDSHLSGLIPNSKRVIIENAGHEMFRDNPDGTNRAIICFLAGEN